jgi:ribosome-binding protein aMBF1 (putative translation factor)
MNRLEDLEKKWMKDPAFVKAYDALEDEFAIIGALISARAHAGFTQAQLARKMKTTQSVIAHQQERCSN